MNTLKHSNNLFNLEKSLTHTTYPRITRDSPAAFLNRNNLIQYIPVIFQTGHFGIPDWGAKS